MVLVDDKVNTLSCKDLVKYFDGSCALAGVTLGFPKSGIEAVVGPNGAGKTTLFNVLTGFIRADSGRFYLGQLDISRFPPHRIARLGIARTFQRVRVICQVTVLENVLMACPIQKGENAISAVLQLGVAFQEKQNREYAMQILNSLGLEKYMSCLAGELSYGQKKLLALACCLATEARTIILDEPVAGVHPALADVILDHLQQLRNKEILILFIEHDLNAVRQIADTVVVMDKGKIIGQGKPGELLERSEIAELFLV
jgi:branched-chain amino acid transport system ATP-binding protein